MRKSECSQSITRLPFRVGVIIGIVLVADFKNYYLPNSLNFVRMLNEPMFFQTVNQSDSEISDTTVRRNETLFATKEASRDDIVSKRSQRRLYIDLGANCGNTYQRAKIGGRRGAQKTLKKPSPEVWETFLWECNPHLIEWYLNDLVRNESNVTLIPNAASTSNGYATFFLTAGQETLSKDKLPNAECNPKSPSQPGGASSLYGSALRASKISNITVVTRNFLEWHKELNLQLGDSVHIKIDIEGAELDIIEDFLDNDPTNQICYWDIFWIEYHKNIFPKNTSEYKRHEIFENELPARFAAKCNNKTLYPNVPL